MVVSAHPDDAELGCGGVIIDLTSKGRNVVLVDCTRGELGTRGTPEIRAAEAQAANAVLGVETRVNLEMPDGAVEHTLANVHLMSEAIRRYRPQLLLIPPPIERHPDHGSVHTICTAANFLSGVTNVKLAHNDQELAVHRAHDVMCYQQQFDFPSLPSFYVDVTHTFDRKMEAILAYRSQFHTDDAEFAGQPLTMISRPDYLLELEARARYYGSRIGVTYAEAFLSVQPLGLSSMSVLL